MGPPIDALTLPVNKDHKYVLIAWMLLNGEHKEVHKFKLTDCALPYAN